jgi:anti-sigma factor RsiW
MTMKNPARERFLPLLSPYVDGELPPDERRQVEQHLANEPKSASQVADFRAGDALMRHALETQADEVDWKGFTDGVMARLTPDRLPWLLRLKVAFSETLTWQRGPLLGGLAGAAAAVAIVIPVTLRYSTPDGYGAARVQVQTVAVDTEAKVKPVVMETDDGDAVIWVLDAPEEAQEKPAPDEPEPGPDSPGKTPASKGEL